jgi:CheY-like chemotaxis protein
MVDGGVVDDEVHLHPDAALLGAVGELDEVAERAVTRVDAVIVRDGHVQIYSEPSEGTTIKLYLPHLLAPAEDQAELVAHVPEGTRDETVLVCEDDAGVRAYSAEALRELGYRVLGAPDAACCLRLLDEQPDDVDLLFSDLLLPGGSDGDQLASEASRRRPGLKVLLTTGYARDAILYQGRLDHEAGVITKPFTYADLAARVRDALDRGL